MILFLTTFFLIFTLICVKNIRCGVYAVIFSMSLYLWRFSIFEIPTTVLEIMIYILFFVWALNRIRKVLSRDNFYPKSFNKLVYNDIIQNLERALAESFNGFRCFRKNNFALSIGIALLFLGLTLSTFYSSNLRTSLGVCKGWFIDPFLFFVVFINVIKEKRHIISSLASWIFSGVAVSIISIFYLLNNDLTFDGRLKAFFLSPNHLSMYLAPAFLIVLFFLLCERKIDNEKLKILDIKYWILNIKKLMNCELTNLFAISNIQYPVFIVIISIPLYFTYSYGAFLGIFAGVAWLFYKIQICHFDRSERGMSERSGGICKRDLFVSADISSKNLSANRSLGSLLLARDNKLKRMNKELFLKILILIILVTFISITAVKFNQIVNSENRSSLHSRLMIWNTAVEIIKDNPVLGIGPGTFQDVYLSYSNRFNEPYLEWAVPQPHNIFLAFYLQTGLIGFIGFILILVWFFYSRLKNKNNNIQPACRTGRYLISNVLTILMIYILIHGLIDTTYWKNDLSLMFWLIIGMELTSFKNIDNG